MVKITSTVEVTVQEVGPFLQKLYKMGMVLGLDIVSLGEEGIVEYKGSEKEKVWKGNGAKPTKFKHKKKRVNVYHPRNGEPLLHERVTTLIQKGGYSSINKNKLSQLTVEAKGAPGSTTYVTWMLVKSGLLSRTDYGEYAVNAL